MLRVMFECFYVSDRKLLGPVYNCVTGVRSDIDYTMNASRRNHARGTVDLCNKNLVCNLGIVRRRGP
jgi:hypothetical protein